MINSTQTVWLSVDQTPYVDNYWQGINLDSAESQAVQEHNDGKTRRFPITGGDNVRRNTGNATLERDENTRTD